MYAVVFTDCVGNYKAQVLDPADGEKEPSKRELLSYGGFGVLYTIGRGGGVLILPLSPAKRGSEA